MKRHTARWTRAAVALAGVLSVAGCSLIGTDGGSADSGTVTLVTHDSFAISDEARESFERESGYELRVRKTGDAGALTNELVLTKDAPIGDVAFGVDSTFYSRALDADVFVPYRPRGSASIPVKYAVADTRLTPIDAGDVCVNIDKRWFAEHDVEPPRNLRDLTEPRYRGLFAVPSPETSSPGLAFLLNTVATFGPDQGWKNYWSRLVDNDVRVSSSWQEAYNQDFSGSSGSGQRPIVLSYASSPAAEVDDQGRARTEALLDTCYRQVEYAGVLRGAEHPKAARELMDFLLSWTFQSQVPEQMYVYPTVLGVELPENWERVAPRPEDSTELDPRRVEDNRAEWISQWRELTRR
ncbi:thiamine ABC transporter substrate-binding protein [Actinopolyspora mortivallis]|uniref:thiamine ABC transporter substrate-binding protein n=1 Tax=Actinopolyspora mortivallis TaxID=33906 RepID=UPI00037A018A|nr:thiamine ABC transporter substrate-binding protein [Actinopolyspora mortivallis]